MGKGPRVGLIHDFRGNAKRYWHYLNGEGVKVGTLAGYISLILQGKHKPYYSHGKDDGDYLVLTNCDRLIFTGDKMYTKKYYWHTGYPGGLRSITPWELQYVKNKPEEIINRAVKGALPNDVFRKTRMQRFHVHAGDDHDFSHIDFDYSRQLPRLYDVRGYLK